MAKRDRWRKAMTISVLVHCLLFGGVGWLGGNLLKAAQPPDLIEVELISDPGRSKQRDNLSVIVPTTGAASAFAQTTIAADKSAVVTEMTADAVTEAVSASSTTANAGGGGMAQAGMASSAGGSGSGPVVPRRIAAPRLLAKIEPVYPEEARQTGAEGTVGVRIEIKENGHPGDINVVRSSGRASFDAAAVEAIRSWRFVPAQEVESGRAVRSYTTVSIVFRLRT